MKVGAIDLNRLGVRVNRVYLSRRASASRLGTQRRVPHMFHFRDGHFPRAE